MSKVETEGCKTCRYFVEIIGLGKPHPLRCRYRNAKRQLDHLEYLPPNEWCIFYKAEDGKARMVPMQEQRGRK